jgi:hypothetical protein
MKIGKRRNTNHIPEKYSEKNIWILGKLIGL